MGIWTKKSVAILQAEAGAQDDAHTLRRALGALNLTTLGIGAIIGAGIFVLTGTAAANYAGPAIVYSFILAGLGSLLTGLAIYKPVQFGWLAFLFGGYQMARWFHFWLTVGYVVFFVVHVAQVVKAGWNNFRAMVIGAELREVSND